MLSSILAVDIMSDVERASGAATRRRERRLRQFLRHERVTVAMALAENLHHSRQKVEGVAYVGPRAQKTARATGARPGVLEEPEPQGGAVTDGYVAAPAPFLSSPMLADAAGEKVDQSTLGFLLNHAIAVQKVYEEEERRQKEEKEKEEARKALEDSFSSPWALAAETRGSQEKKEEKRRRKKKKRRKKKSPKTSSSACRRVRLPWRCHELYGVSGGGGFCSPDGAYSSVWDSVMPITGIFLPLFPVPGVVWCVCMLNGWFSSKDTICADNYIFFWFKLQACVAVRSGRFFCTATSSSRWTVFLRLCCPEVCLRLALLCRLRFFTLLGNGYTFYVFCLPSARCMGMNMFLVNPVSSRKYCGTCVSTGPAADPAVMSFTALLSGSTIVAAAAVETTCSASADCTVSTTPMCSGGVCVVMSCVCGSFTSDCAYVSLLDSVKPMMECTSSILPVPRGCRVRMLAGWLDQQRRRDLCRQLQLLPGSS